MALHTAKNKWAAQIRLKVYLFVFKGHEVGRVGMRMWSLKELWKRK